MHIEQEKHLEKEAKRATAQAIVDQIQQELPTVEAVRRYLRRHSGFIHGHITTDNHHQALLYANRLTEGEPSGHDYVIGHAIKRVVHRHLSIQQLEKEAVAG